ncbi:hypothetical protein DF030_09215 [Burkholderia cenocepacia]|nr:hypothetical protein DF030_09215 [Burkholderia cenocepacia]
MPVHRAGPARARGAKGADGRVRAKGGGPGAEGGRRKAGGGRRKAEGGRRKAEGRHREPVRIFVGEAVEQHVIHAPA